MNMTPPLRPSLFCMISSKAMIDHGRISLDQDNNSNKKLI